MGVDTKSFVQALEIEIQRMLAELEMLRDDEVAGSGAPEIVRRLKVALKQELEASQLAADWMASTPQIDIKMGLARQCGDEAKHFRLITKRLLELGEDPSSYDLLPDGYSPMYQALLPITDPVERVGAAQFTREAVAVVKNRQFIEFCKANGDQETARLYEEDIQPDEQFHVLFGRAMLEKHALTPEQQARVREASRRTLELARRMAEHACEALNLSHAPGC